MALSRVQPIGEIGAGEPLVSAGSGGNTYEDED